MLFCIFTTCKKSRFFLRVPVFQFYYSVAFDQIRHFYSLQKETSHFKTFSIPFQFGFGFDQKHHSLPPTLIIKVETKSH